MTQSKTESIDTVPFETALKKLEEIVRRLEAGDLTLQDSLTAFEEGIQWSRVCEARLAEAKGKVEILVKQADGEFAPEPLAIS
ncbi:MAG: exodeoxyribonuclease VII small subunit [Deltaproteobacteria bacterium]|nr:exodeoxyribonuclease VII small subunit [Deltaproteobacteria bacterium]